MRLPCLAASLCLVACHSSDRDASFACTLDAKPAVKVTLTSAATGQPLTGAVASLTEGAFSETMTEPEPGLYLGAFERKGTYVLRIAATGFRPHMTNGIVVTHDGCHVVTQEFKIALSTLEGSREFLLIQFDGERHSIGRARMSGVDR